MPDWFTQNAPDQKKAPNDWFSQNAPSEGQRALKAPVAASPLQSAWDWFTSPSTWQASPGFARFANPSQQPSSFYQTRITHMPGGVVPQDALGGAFGQYSNTQSPVEAIQASNLSPQDKAKLIAQWQNLGPGFISATPEGVTRPDVMRHEELHGMQYHSPEFLSHEAQIAGLVNPYIISGLHATPLYQKEMKELGTVPVESMEGSAFDLIPGMTTATHQQSPALRAYMLDLMKKDPVKRKQLERLTDLSQLPNYQP